MNRKRFLYFHYLKNNLLRNLILSIAVSIFVFGMSMADGNSSIDGVVNRVLVVFMTSMLFIGFSFSTFLCWRDLSYVKPFYFTEGIGFIKRIIITYVFTLFICLSLFIIVIILR